MTTPASDHEEKFRKINVTPVAKGLYFSDLTDDQLMALFCKGPLLRFQICAVNVLCKRSGVRNKLYGSIQIAEQATEYVINRESNHPIVVPGYQMFLDGISRSIPASNNVEIHAKLYATSDRDFDKFSIDDDSEVDDKDITTMVQVEKPDDDKLPKTSAHLLDEDTSNAYWELWFCSDEFVKKDEIDNEPFEFCNDSSVVNLSDGPSFGLNILEGQGGFVHLYYVAFKYAVDATVEVDFVADNKETKVDGVVRASYGNNFDYGSGCEKHLYKVMLVMSNYIDYRDFLRPGKLNLTDSALAVPAQFSLVIDAMFVDIASEDTILDGSYEFHVPRDGSSSCGSIVGIGCHLDVKVDWKLPDFAMRSL